MQNNSNELTNLQLAMVRILHEKNIIIEDESTYYLKISDNSIMVIQFGEETKNSYKLTINENEQFLKLETGIYKKVYDLEDSKKLVETYTEITEEYQVNGNKLKYTKKETHISTKDNKDEKISNPTEISKEFELREDYKITDGISMFNTNKEKVKVIK